MIMFALISVFLIVPGMAYGAYRVSKARAGRPDEDPVLKKSRSDKSRQQVDQRRLGYRYADEKIFVQGNGVFTGVVMGTSSDEFATDEETVDIVSQPIGLEQDLLKLFNGKNVHCHEQIRYRTITSEGWLRQLLANAWNPTELYSILSGKIAEHIKGSTPQRIWVMFIRLGDLPARAVSDPLAPVMSQVLGVAEERLTRKDLAPWRALASQVHRAASRRGAEPLSRRDLIWLIRKPLSGNLPIPDEPVARRRPWRGGFFELAAVLRGENLGGGVIALHHRNAETGVEETSYTATLVLQDQPPRQVFNPRHAWGRKLGKLANPVEISWRYTLIPGPEWRRITERAAANVEDERQDRIKAGASEDLTFQARLEQADLLRSDNADDPQPGMIGRLRLSVSASTPKALAVAIQDAKAAMGDIEVEVCEHAALPLLEEQLPGESLPAHMGSLSAGPAGGLRLWERYTDTWQPAIGMLGSHSQVGDRVQVERGRSLGWIGQVIGYVKSNGSVVHFDPHAMVSRLNGAGIAVTGASGGGKSSFMLSMFFWLSESGVRCRAVDPKIEFRNFVYYIAFGPQVLDPGFLAEADAGTLGTPGSRFQPVLPQFWADTDVFDLARGARGSRDPWRITKSYAEGYNLALDFIDLLFAEPDHRRIVKKGLRGLHNARKAALSKGDLFSAGFGDVVDYIKRERDDLAADLEAARKNSGDTSRIREAFDQAEEVFTRLENGEEQPFLRLLLGKGSDPAPDTSAPHKRRTIYTMSGYVTPADPDPDTWTDSERNAATAMSAVLYDLHSGLDGRMVANPVTGRPGIPPTATFVDEGNMLTAQAPGRGFLRKCTRQGRSLFHVLFFADQRSRGISRIEEEARAEDQAEVNQFGAVAVFPQRSRTEARMGLELLRTDGDESSNGKTEKNEIAKNLLREELGGRLRPGDCAFRDPDSRVAGITVDLIFRVLQRASQTNAKYTPDDWAHDVPRDPAEWEINPDALDAVRTNVDAAEEDDDYGYDDSVDRRLDLDSFDDDQLLDEDEAEDEDLGYFEDDRGNADDYLPEDDQDSPAGRSADLAAAR